MVTARQFVIRKTVIRTATQISLQALHHEEHFIMNPENKLAMDIYIYTSAKRLFPANFFAIKYCGKFPC